MQLHELINKMSETAQTTVDDVLSVKLCRLANRLSHQGMPFEPPLTDAELRMVNSFVKGEL